MPLTGSCWKPTQTERKVNSRLSCVTALVEDLVTMLRDGNVKAYDMISDFIYRLRKLFYQILDFWFCFVYMYNTVCFGKKMLEFRSCLSGILTIEAFTAKLF